MTGLNSNFDKHCLNTRRFGRLAFFKCWSEDCSLTLLIYTVVAGSRALIILIAEGFKDTFDVIVVNVDRLLPYDYLVSLEEKKSLLCHCSH